MNIKSECEVLKEQLIKKEWNLNSDSMMFSITEQIAAKTLNTIEYIQSQIKLTDYEQNRAYVDVENLFSKLYNHGNTKYLENNMRAYVADSIPQVQKIEKKDSIQKDQITIYKEALQIGLNLFQQSKLDTIQDNDPIENTTFSMPSMTNFNSKENNLPFIYGTKEFIDNDSVMRQASPKKKRAGNTIISSIDDEIIKKSETKKEESKSKFEQKPSIIDRSDFSSNVIRQTNEKPIDQSELPTQKIIQPPINILQNNKTNLTISQPIQPIIQPNNSNNKETINMPIPPPPPPNLNLLLNNSIPVKKIEIPIKNSKNNIAIPTQNINNEIKMPPPHVNISNAIPIIVVNSDNIQNNISNFNTPDKLIEKLPDISLTEEKRPHLKSFQKINENRLNIRKTSDLFSDDGGKLSSDSDDELMKELKKRKNNNLPPLVEKEKNLKIYEDEQTNDIVITRPSMRQKDFDLLGEKEKIPQNKPLNRLFEDSDEEGAKKFTGRNSNLKHGNTILLQGLRKSHRPMDETHEDDIIIPKNEIKTKSFFDENENEEKIENIPKIENYETEKKINKAKQSLFKDETPHEFEGNLINKPRKELKKLFDDSD